MKKWHLFSLLFILNSCKQNKKDIPVLTVKITYYNGDVDTVRVRSTSVGFMNLSGGFAQATVGVLGDDDNNIIAVNVRKAEYVR